MTRTIGYKILGQKGRLFGKPFGTFWDGLALTVLGEANGEHNWGMVRIRYRGQTENIQGMSNE